MLHRFLKAISYVPKAQYLLFSSITELEHAAISAIRNKISLPVDPIGFAVSHHHHHLSPSPPSHFDYLKWLESQPKGSVLYVSMGSKSPISAFQMEEIAAGLLDGGVKFLLVARRGGGETTLSCGGGDGEGGAVVGWCDQIRVLSHAAVGRFRTHCGWNSVLEGIFAGVPMLTFPMVMDQVPNSKLVVEDWGVGVRVSGGPPSTTVPMAAEVLRKEEIAALVRRFVDVDSEERKLALSRVKALKETCEEAIAKGGSSRVKLGCFINDICANHAHLRRV